ncbi:MAG: hypothetical protein KGI11_08705 [Thaumarchaeota archaeon]|nr:hypothetical protein [Nitrososphaerota archaeon]
MGFWQYSDAVIVCSGVEFFQLGATLGAASLLMYCGAVQADKVCCGVLGRPVLVQYDIRNGSNPYKYQ